MKLALFCDIVKKRTGNLHDFRDGLILFLAFFFQNLLTETSEQLYNVTRGRVQWDRVTFLLPRNYTTDCVFSSNQPRRVQTKSRRTDRHLAEVVVGGDHPLLADLPWADQFYGGCGVPGRGVHLSRSFISSFSPSNSFLQGMAASPYNKKFGDKVIMLGHFYDGVSGNNSIQLSYSAIRTLWLFIKQYANSIWRNI